MISFTLASEKWSDQAKRLLRETGRDAGEVLKQEGRLFLQDCIKLTPPTGKRPFAESYNVQRRAGEQAIANDIRRVFIDWHTLGMVKKHPQIMTALTLYAAGSKPDLKNPANKLLKKLFNGYQAGFKRELQRQSQSSLDEARTLLSRIGVKTAVIREVFPKLHQSARGAGGRVLHGQGTKKIVLQTESIPKYIKSQQKKVGMEKAGWIPAATALGVKLPAWITNHPGQPGLWRDEVNHENPSITMGNLVGYAQEHGRRLLVIKRALDQRVESLTRRIDAMVKKRFKEA